MLNNLDNKLKSLFTHNVKVSLKTTSFCPAGGFGQIKSESLSKTLTGCISLHSITLQQGKTWPPQYKILRTTEENIEDH